MTLHLIHIIIPVVTCDSQYTIIGSASTSPTSHQYGGKLNYSCPEGQRLEDGLQEVGVDCTSTGNWKDWQFYQKCAGTM